MYTKLQRDFYGEPPNGMQILLERCESAMNYETQKIRIKSSLAKDNLNLNRPLTSYGLRQNRPHEIRNKFLQTPKLQTPQPSKAKSVSELRRRHFLDHMERELESRIYSRTPSNYSATPSSRRGRYLQSKSSAKYDQESDDEKEIEDKDDNVNSDNDNKEEEELSRPQSSAPSKHSSESNKEKNSQNEVAKSHLLSDSRDSMSKCSTKSSLKGTKIEENEEENIESSKKQPHANTEIDFQSLNPFAMKFLTEMNDPSDLYHVTREEIVKKPIIALKNTHTPVHQKHELQKIRKSSVSIDLSLLEFNHRESSATDRKRSRTSRFVNWSKRSKLLVIIKKV